MGKIIEFHQDAGHGWIKVSLKEIKELGIQNMISSCSYVKGKDAYLEEDCDAGVYITALKASNDLGFTLRWEEIYDGDDSPIRQYKCYDKEEIDWETL